MEVLSLLGQPSKDAKESDYKEGDLIFECQYEVVDLKGDESEYTCLL